MKTTLIFDLKEDIYKRLEYENDGTNDVVLQFVNCDVVWIGDHPRIDYHKTEKFVETASVTVENNQIITTVPPEYISDGDILHFRFVRDTKAYCFYHIRGDITKHTDVQLKAITTKVFDIVAAIYEPTPPTPPPPDPPTPEPAKTIDFISEVGAPNYNLTSLDFEMEIQTCVKEEG